MKNDGYALLIGGSFHRTKVCVHKGQKVIAMAKNNFSPINGMVNIDDIHEGCKELYFNYEVDFSGDFAIDHLYFIQGLDPKIWAMNLVLDYIR